MNLDTRALLKSDAIEKWCFSSDCLAHRLFAESRALQKPVCVRYGGRPYSAGQEPPPDAVIPGGSPRGVRPRAATYRPVDGRV